MPRIRLDRDLRSVTEFRANAAKLIERVRTTKRPLVLTQHGRGAAVLVDVGEFEKMVEHLQASVPASPRGADAHASAAASEASGQAHERPDPVDAYKDAIDRSLLIDNLGQPVSERLRRLTQMASFAGSLGGARKRARGEAGAQSPPATDDAS